MYVVFCRLHNHLSILLKHSLFLMNVKIYSDKNFFFTTCVTFLFCKRNNSKLLNLLPNLYREANHILMA